MGAKDALVTIGKLNCGLEDTYGYYSEEELEQGGQFAMPPLPEADAAAAAARRSGAEGLTFELLRRAAAAHIELAEGGAEHLAHEAGHLPQAARLLKRALALKPAHPAVVATLDDVARRAAEAGVGVFILCGQKYTNVNFENVKKRAVFFNENLNANENTDILKNIFT